VIALSGNIITTRVIHFLRATNLSSVRASIWCCGPISQYNATSLADGPDRISLLIGAILRKRMTMRGFIVFDDFGNLHREFARQMDGWIRHGKIQYREEMMPDL